MAEGDVAFGILAIHVEDKVVVGDLKDATDEEGKVFRPRALEECSDNIVLLEASRHIGIIVVVLTWLLLVRCEEGLEICFIPRAVGLEIVNVGVLVAAAYGMEYLVYIIGE